MRRRKGLGARLRELFGVGVDTDAFFEELEDGLVEADLGSALTMDVVDQLRDRARRAGHRLRTREELVAELTEILRPEVKTVVPPVAPDTVHVVLVLGVNGVGKTTTIAKLGAFWGKTVQPVVFAAGDTFRAAAVEQLRIQADRVGARFVAQGQGADPAAVIHDAVSSARSAGKGLVLADTAGRLHNRKDLVKQLEKIDGVIRRFSADIEYRKMLVVDATTGQNALRQAEVFHEAIGVDFAVLTKFDSTARGGMVLPICRSTDIPFAFLGVGETADSLLPFDADDYLAALLADTDQGSAAGEDGDDDS